MKNKKMPTLVGGVGDNKWGDKQWHQQDRVYSTEGIAMAHPAQIPGGSYLYAILEKENNMRVRRLTPKECWRLMGFSDEDFEKARAVNSDTQLYKQAGNSIVVDVLVAILRNLLTGDREEQEIQRELW